MKELKFPNQQDAIMRIDGGVGLYEGTPVRVSIEDGVTMLFDLMSTSKGPWKLLDWNDEALITRSLPTGYFDCRWTRRDIDMETGMRKWVEIPTVAWAARSSHRRQKSMLHPHNVSLKLPDGIGGYWDGSYNQMYSPGFGKMLLNEYSTNRDFSAFKESEGQALSRNFAVVKLGTEWHLLFNELKVGSKKDPTANFDLDDDYKNCLMTMRLANLGVYVN